MQTVSLSLSHRALATRIRPLVTRLTAALIFGSVAAEAGPVARLSIPAADSAPLPWLEAMAPPGDTTSRVAATLPVTSCSDDPDDAGSLRNVIAGAVSGDTIDLSQLTCGTISLVQGAVAINVNDLAIQGPGQDVLVIENANVSSPTNRIFNGTHYGNVSISDVTIAHGFDSRRGGCIIQMGNLVLSNVTITSCSTSSSFSDTQGGGAYVRGNVTLTGATISGNTTASGNYRVASGGGLAVYGTATITGTTISGNTSAGTYSVGGGLYLIGNATITDSAITGNTASQHGTGGGLVASANLVITGSTIDSNISGGDGGGLGSEAYRAHITIQIVNSTISGNSAANGGGGIASTYRSLELDNTTVAFNTATTTGGGGMLFRGASSLTLQSTIIADNTSGGGATYAADLGMPASVTATGSNNLVVTADGTLPGGTLQTDPLLFSLAHNGGPTQTHALQVGSPAIDAGNNSGGLAFDQRGDGFPRVVGAAADIGAFEVQSTAPPPVPPIIDKSFLPVAIFVNGTSQVTIALANTNATAATLTADLIDTLPSGLVVANPATAATDCPNGSVDAVAGADTITLTAGAQIPAAGGCSVTAMVTAADVDTFTNTIPTGALQTDLGNNQDPASADLSVTIETHTVTPIAEEGGTIEPDLPQTVDDGDTTAFTLTPGPGRHIATVGGTCGGALSGNIFTTAPVTADCTVDASFSSDIDAYLKYSPVFVPTDPATNYRSGPGVHLLVAALNPTRLGKAVFLSSIETNAGLYGFDGVAGTALPGFAPATPPPDRGGVVYPLAIATEPTARINGTSTGAPYYDILAAHWNGALRLFDADGSVLWDQGAANYVAEPGSSYGTILADQTQDAHFIVDEESFTVYGRLGRSGDTVWQGIQSAQQFVTPAIVNVGADDASFVLGSGNGNGECDVQRIRIDNGETVWTQHMVCNPSTFVAAGDIDGNPGDEIATVLKTDSDPSTAVVAVFDANNGALMWEYPLSEGSLSGTAPVLADLDGDGAAEIVVQTETQLHVIKYGIGEMPGWPVILCNNCQMGNSAPVVGDLDGDPDMEIAAITQQSGSDQTGYLNIFDQNGQRKLISGPVQLPIGPGRAPAIADVDGDGHNELLIGGVAASSPALYVIDFSSGDPTVHHGPVLWGQFGADPQHTNRVHVAAPTVAKSFAPATIATGDTSVLTLTLVNALVTPATLSADLVDALPNGLVIADPADASTDCPAGVVDALPGGSEVSLGTGAEIPATSSCVVIVSVTSNDEGTYTNLIPASALRTDLGASVDPASADLVVTPAQIPDRLFADGFDGSSGQCEPQQLLQDPGFEATDPGDFVNPFWSSSSTTFGTALCNAITCGDGGGSAFPHAGAFWAWFGGVDHTSESASVAQMVAIPTGSARFLNFWLFIGAVGGADANLDVSVDGQPLGSFPEPTVPDGGYLVRSVDVSAFADGATHAVEFDYTQSASGDTTNYSLDDVTLDCTAATGAPASPPQRALHGSLNRLRRDDGAR